MIKLTFHKPNGEFGVAGMNETNQDQKLYMCVCKLKDYEKTELSPDGVERLKEQVEDFKQQIVYCRECESYYKGCCSNAGIGDLIPRKPTDFCSYGAKKE